MRLLLAMISGWLVCACGASAHEVSPVRVSGTVLRVCPGPARVGPPHCLQTAVLSGRGGRITVRGRFTVTVLPGRYHVTVDGCAQRAPLNIEHAISRLRLAPLGCAYPA